MDANNTECAKHCWHHTGITYTSNPPQWDEICCFCGEIRRVCSAIQNYSGHGDYAPTGLYSGQGVGRID